MSLRSLLQHSRPVNHSFFLCFAGKKVCYARENEGRTEPLDDGRRKIDDFYVNKSKEQILF